MIGVGERDEMRDNAGKCEVAWCSLSGFKLSRLVLHVCNAGERIVYGDSKGNVIMLLCGTRVWPARDLICQDEYQDYIVVHDEHEDWVSQVCPSSSAHCLYFCHCTTCGTHMAA